jgi:hypothetical protein
MGMHCSVRLSRIQWQRDVRYNTNIATTAAVAEFTNAENCYGGNDDVRGGPRGGTGRS